MSKRGLNIYKRKDGRWEGRIRQTVVKSGIKKYRSVYGSTYRECKEKMMDLMSEQESNIGKCTFTIAQVVNIWINDKKYVWKESTCACYKQLIKLYMRNDIAMQKAESFSNAAYNEYLGSIRKMRDGSKISASYARNIGGIFRQAFSYVSAEYNYNLPVLVNKKISSCTKCQELPSDDTMKKLTKYLYSHTDDSTCIGILTAFYTGIRIGELCALKWGDIDFREGVLKIDKNMQRIKEFDAETAATTIKVQEPKTDTSARRIPIPDILMKILKENRKADTDYLIVGKRKEWAETRTLQYRFAAILKKCGIEHFKFHMLRHYFASLCIREGVDIKSLSEILGHANIQITLNLYVHSTINQKRVLMNKVFDVHKI
ncbi:MAG: site-specific integrase [Butyrivibrio sp.]|nr:site-specific integrase [Butyrivibrio sp.]